MIVRTVTGPVVVLPDATTGKTTYYYQGAVLPDGLAEDRVADVVASGLVTEQTVADTDSSDESEGAAPVDPEKVPDGTADEVKAWVGDSPERAAQALAVEEASTKPRSTLVDHLTKLANPA